MNKTYKKTLDSDGLTFSPWTLDKTDRPTAISNYTGVHWAIKSLKSNKWGQCAVITVVKSLSPAAESTLLFLSHHVTHHSHFIHMHSVWFINMHFKYVCHKNSLHEKCPSRLILLWLLLLISLCQLGLLTFHVPGAYMGYFLMMW